MDDHGHREQHTGEREPADDSLAQQWADAADRTEDDRVADTATHPAVQAELADESAPWPQPGGPRTPDTLDPHRIEQAANRAAYRLHLPLDDQPGRHAKHYLGMTSDPATREAEHTRRYREDDREL